MMSSNARLIMKIAWRKLNLIPELSRQLIHRDATEASNFEFTCGGSWKDSDHDIYYLVPLVKLVNLARLQGSGAIHLHSLLQCEPYTNHSSFTLYLPTALQAPPLARIIIILTYFIVLSQWKEQIKTYDIFNNHRSYLSS